MYKGLVFLLCTWVNFRVISYFTDRLTRLREWVEVMQKFTHDKKLNIYKKVSLSTNHFILKFELCFRNTMFGRKVLSEQAYCTGY
jgi:hypothetical protein